MSATPVVTTTPSSVPSCAPSTSTAAGRTMPQTPGIAPSHAGTSGTPSTTPPSVYVPPTHSLILTELRPGFSHSEALRVVGHGTPALTRPSRVPPPSAFANKRDFGTARRRARQAAAAEDSAIRFQELRSLCQRARAALKTALLTPEEPTASSSDTAVSTNGEAAARSEEQAVSTTAQSARTAAVARAIASIYRTTHILRLSHRLPRPLWVYSSPFPGVPATICTHPPPLVLPAASAPASASGPAAAEGASVIAGCEQPGYLVCHDPLAAIVQRAEELLLPFPERAAAASASTADGDASGCTASACNEAEGSCSACECGGNDSDDAENVYGVTNDDTSSPSSPAAAVAASAAALESRPISSGVPPSVWLHSLPSQPSFRVGTEGSRYPVVYTALSNAGLAEIVSALPPSATAAPSPMPAASPAPSPVAASGSKECNLSSASTAAAATAAATAAADDAVDAAEGPEPEQNKDEASPEAASDSSGETEPSAPAPPPVEGSSVSPIWSIRWGRIITAEDARSLTTSQRMNHFPGIWALGRKDLLVRSIDRLRRTAGSDAFPYLPETYVLPQDAAVLEARMASAAAAVAASAAAASAPAGDAAEPSSAGDAGEEGECPEHLLPLWIAKPAASSCGRGIRIVTRFSEVDPTKPATGTAADDDDDASAEPAAAAAATANAATAEVDAVPVIATAATVTDVEPPSDAGVAAAGETTAGDGAAAGTGESPEEGAAAVEAATLAAAAAAAVAAARKRMVVSQYIANPFLIGGRKFDLRIYVLVPASDPLRIYVYGEGLARFCTQQYSASADKDSRKARFAHLTNFSVNKHNNAFVKNEDAEADIDDADDGSDSDASGRGDDSDDAAAAGEGAGASSGDDDDAEEQEGAISRAVNEIDDDNDNDEDNDDGDASPAAAAATGNIAASGGAGAPRIPRRSPTARSSTRSGSSSGSRFSSSSARAPRRVGVWRDLFPGRARGGADPDPRCGVVGSLAEADTDAMYARTSTARAAAAAAAGTGADEGDMGVEDAAVAKLGGLNSSKWALTTLRKYLAAVEGTPATNLLFAKINDLIVRTVIAAEDEISACSQRRGLRPDQCFELLGFDVMIDANLSPWLIEVNMGPSLTTSSPLDRRIKTALLRDAFNIVGVPAPGDGTGAFAPPRHAAVAAEASAQAERDMRALRAVSSGQPLLVPVSTYTPTEVSAISSAAAGPGGASTGTVVAHIGPSGAVARAAARELTPDDLRLVRITEFEYLRRGSFSRLFPHPSTHHEYAALLSQRRRGNRVLLRFAELPAATAAALIGVPAEAYRQAGLFGGVPSLTSHAAAAAAAAAGVSAATSVGAASATGVGVAVGTRAVGVSASMNTRTSVRMKAYSPSGQVSVDSGQIITLDTDTTAAAAGAIHPTPGVGATALGSRRGLASGVATSGPGMRRRGVQVKLPRTSHPFKPLPPLAAAPVALDTAGKGRGLASLGLPSAGMYGRPGVTNSGSATPASYSVRLPGTTAGSSVVIGSFITNRYLQGRTTGKNNALSSLSDGSAVGSQEGRTKASGSGVSSNGVHAQQWLSPAPSSGPLVSQDAVRAWRLRLQAEAAAAAAVMAEDTAAELAAAAAVANLGEESATSVSLP